MEIERGETGQGRARLFFTTLGHGPDVVLLHPTPVHHAFWLPVAERLAHRYRFILPDLRGHGKSTISAAAASETIEIATLAEDVHAVLRVLGIDRAAFVGCSIGGYLLYEYWRRFPLEMAALVPICGKPQADTPENREKRRESIRLAQAPGGLEAFFDRTADTLVGSTARRIHPEIRTVARAMMDAMSLDAMIATQQALMERPDSVATLPTIHAPVSAIAAEEDPSSTPQDMRIVADNVPGAEFHVLPGTGHYAPLEQPEAVAKILEDFLGRLNLEARIGPTPGAEPAGPEPEGAGSERWGR